MTDQMIVTYQSGTKTLTFALESDFWMSEISGLETQIDMATSQGVGQYGETVNAQSVQAKTITFTGDIHGDVVSNRAKLLGTVLPYAPAIVTFTQEGESWQIEGYPTKTAIIEGGVGVQSFQFSIFAPYPYLRSVETKEYVIAGITPLWETPFNMQETVWISRYTEDLFAHVSNSGNVPQGFVLEMYARASVTNPSFYYVEQGSAIHFNYELAEGDRIRISTYDKDKDAGLSAQLILSDTSVKNAFRYISPESDLDIKIPPGGATFMADALENKANLQCVLVTAGGECHSL